MQPKHSAIVAGLTLALSFGAVSAPAPAAAEEPTPGVASDATDIDKGLYTQQSFSGVLRSVQGVSFVNVTPEMKYFTKYESHGNYNQGFSYGDGYNALGYYQFDRRWSLIPFMKQVYNYDSAKYGMLKDAIDRGGEISNAKQRHVRERPAHRAGPYRAGRLSRVLTTPTLLEFSALQDAYAYNSYYAVARGVAEERLWALISRAAPTASRAWCGALPTCAAPVAAGTSSAGRTFPTSTVGPRVCDGALQQRGQQRGDQVCKPAPVS